MPFPKLDDATGTFLLIGRAGVPLSSFKLYYPNQLMS